MVVAVLVRALAGHVLGQNALGPIVEDQPVLHAPRLSVRGTGVDNRRDRLELPAVGVWAALVLVPEPHRDPRCHVGLGGEAGIGNEVHVEVPRGGSVVGTTGDHYEPAPLEPGAIARLDVSQAAAALVGPTARVLLQRLQAVRLLHDLCQESGGAHVGVDAALLHLLYQDVSVLLEGRQVLIPGYCRELLGGEERNFPFGAIPSRPFPSIPLRSFPFHWALLMIVAYWHRLEALHMPDPLEAEYGMRPLRPV